MIPFFRSFSPSRRWAGFASVAIASAFFSGCATGPTVAVHPDPQVDCSRYHLFALERSNPPTNPEVTPELLRQIQDAATSAFAQRGLRPAEQGQADAVVLVHGGIQERLDVTDWGFNYGRFHRWGYAGTGGPYELRQYREGTLVVDVFDRQTRQLIWRGSAVNEVSGPPNIDRIRAALTQIVSRYPAQAQTTAAAFQLEVDPFLLARK